MAQLKRNSYTNALLLGLFQLRDSDVRDVIYPRPVCRVPGEKDRWEDVICPRRGCRHPSSGSRDECGETGHIILSKSEPDVTNTVSMRLMNDYRVPVLTKYLIEHNLIHHDYY